MRRFFVLPIEPEVRRVLERIPSAPRPQLRKPDAREALLAAIERHKKRRAKIRLERRRREFRKRWMGE